MAISQATLAAIKFDAGSDIDFESFRTSDQVFQDILQLFEDQQLKKYMSTRIKLSVVEVKEWIHTSSSEPDSITGFISGTQVTLTPTILSEVFGLSNGNEELEQSEDRFFEMLLLMGHSQGNPKHLLKKNFSIQLAFLADVVGKVLLGKHSAHDHITRHQFILMSVLVNKIQLNWGAVLFDCIRKKNFRLSVGCGRVLGIVLQERFPVLCVSLPVHINASKRLTSSLFGKWDRVISRPSRAGRSSGNASKGTRAVLPTSPTPEEGFLSSTPILSPPLSPQQQLQQQPHESPHHSPLHSSPHALPHVDIPSFNLMESPISSSPHSSSPHHPEDMNIDTIPPSLPEINITSSTSSAQHDHSEHTSSPSPNTDCPIHSLSDPHTSTQPHELIYVDISSLSNDIFEFLKPRIQELLDASLAPLLATFSGIETKLDSLYSLLHTSVPSSEGLDPGPSGSRQGEMLDEEAPSVAAVPSAEITPDSVAAQSASTEIIFIDSDSEAAFSFFSVVEDLEFHKLPKINLFFNTLPAFQSCREDLSRAIVCSHQVDWATLSLLLSSMCAPAAVSSPAHVLPVPLVVDSPPIFGWNEQPLSSSDEDTEVIQSSIDPV